MIHLENNPIQVDSENKIKLKPELMIKEKLYPFIHGELVFLFFKDDNELIHCYEILNKEVKDNILRNPNKIIEILEKENENNN
ncbi:MAG TPA: hypothetical protein VIY08_14930 [Candidatus Nitrosocosmicus sp.]